MVATKEKTTKGYYDLWLKHGDLLTTLKNFEDEDKFGVLKFP